MSNEIARRELKRIAESLSDHHQEITLLAADLNSRLLSIEGGSNTVLRVKFARSSADDLADLIGAQAERCKRSKDEIIRLRNSLKII